MNDKNSETKINLKVCNRIYVDIDYPNNRLNKPLRNE